MDDRFVHQAFSRAQVPFLTIETRMWLDPGSWMAVNKNDTNLLNARRTRPSASTSAGSEKRLLLFWSGVFPPPWQHIHQALSSFARLARQQFWSLSKAHLFWSIQLCYLTSFRYLCHGFQNEANINLLADAWFPLMGRVYLVYSRILSFLCVL